jgi:hypothetical protein
MAEREAATLLTSAKIFVKRVALKLGPVQAATAEDLASIRTG